MYRLLYLNVIDRVNRNLQYPTASCIVCIPRHKNPHRTFALRAQDLPFEFTRLGQNCGQQSADRYVPVYTLDGLGRMQTHVKRNEIIRMQFHVAHSYSCAATTRVGGGHRSRHLAYRSRSLLLVSAPN